MKKTEKKSKDPLHILGKLILVKTPDGFYKEGKVTKYNDAKDKKLKKEFRDTYRIESDFNAYGVSMLWLYRRPSEINISVEVTQNEKFDRPSKTFKRLIK